MLDLDGRTGEGGGQLVRIAVALAAVTAQPVRITNVRGNRRGGGGLKAQHVSAIHWLAEATGADVQGLAVGSATLVFRPPERRAGGKEGQERQQGQKPGYVFLKAATSAASTSLMLQAVLPYLVFSQTAESEPESGPDPDPIEVEIRGGTHVAWAPTFDYLDQVLFPTLESWFGIRVVERQLKVRGWSTGANDGGSGGGVVRLTVYPVAGGAALCPRMESLLRRPRARKGTDDTHRLPKIVAVDATVISPLDLHEPLATALAREVAESAVLSMASALPSSPDGVDLHFKTMEDSGHDSRVYVLLVARTSEEEDDDDDDGDDDGESGASEGVQKKGKKPVLRWGSDYLSTENFRKRIAGGRGSGGGKAGGSKHGPKGGKGGGRTKAHAGDGFAAPSSSSSPLTDHCARIAHTVVRDLGREVSQGGCGDSHLQDQVVVFQALAHGRTSFWRDIKQGDGDDGGDHLAQPLRALDLDGDDDANDRSDGIDDGKRDRAKGPFGQGSLHAATARWVTSELLGVSWYREGTVCRGVGWTGGKGR